MYQGIKACHLQAKLILEITHFFLFGVWLFIICFGLGIVRIDFRNLLIWHSLHVVLNRRLAGPLDVPQHAALPADKVCCPAFRCQVEIAIAPPASTRPALIVVITGVVSGWIQTVRSPPWLSAESLIVSCISSRIWKITVVGSLLEVPSRYPLLGVFSSHRS